MSEPLSVLSSATGPARPLVSDGEQVARAVARIDAEQEAIERRWWELQNWRHRLVVRCENLTGHVYKRRGPRVCVGCGFRETA